VLSTALFLLLLGLTRPEPQLQTVAAAISAEDAVMKLESAWAAAIRHRDFATCDHLLSPSYFFTDGQGRRLRIASKASWLDLAKTYDVLDVTFDDARVRVYGDTAVVTMLATERAKVAAEDRTTQYFITDIWRHENGAWKLAERHSSRPNPPNKPATH